MTGQSFAIHVKHRPRRVAFLVDMDRSDVDKILGSILSFNLDSWGGRHNPIVPLTDKKVSEDWYRVLDVVDPDIFYIYGDIDAAVLETIHWRYSPTFVTKQHALRMPEDFYTYGVQLREQPRILAYLSTIQDRRLRYFPQPEPCLLQLEHGEERTLSQFFLWNFGYTTANYFAIQNHSVAACRPKSTSDVDLVELFANQLNLAWPIHICGDAPLARTVDDSWRYHFPIFYGESPWNRIAYWNDALTTGRSTPFHAGISQLWLPPNLFEDEATYKQLVLLLRRRVYSSNQQKRLRMLSYDTGVEELERVGRKISQDALGTLWYADSVKLDPPNPGVSAVKPRSTVSFPSNQEEIEYAIGKDVHLPIRRPSEVAEGTDECWMVDVLALNPDQELWYSNAVPWWRLPRKPSIAGLFNRHRPQRIIFDRRASFEVSSREATLDFEMPSDQKLFRHLLSPWVHFHLAADLRSTLREPGAHEIHLSDKGRYLSGIQGLSGSTKEMLYLFEHPFWRALLQKLSQREASGHLISKLSSDAQKLLKNEAWSMDSAERESALTEMIILAARGLPKTAAFMTFKEIRDLHETYLRGLGEDEREHRGRDLKSGLSDLTRANLMFQGVNLQCPNCIASYWYSVEEMKKTVTCRGCHVPFPLPAETEWSYQLNELVRAGIGDHGLMAVIRTLTRLFDDAHDSFLFTPSVDFVVYPDDGEAKVERELDLAWVKDGVFGIAEVKATTKLFQRSDYEDMATLARRVRPDVVLFAAPEGDDDSLIKGRNVIEGKLPAGCEIWTWGPKEFKTSPTWASW